MSLWWSSREEYSKDSEGYYARACSIVLRMDWHLLVMLVVLGHPISQKQPFSPGKTVGIFLSSGSKGGGRKLYSIAGLMEPQCLTTTDNRPP